MLRSRPHKDQKISSVYSYIIISLSLQVYRLIMKHGVRSVGVQCSHCTRNWNPVFIDKTTPYLPESRPIPSDSSLNIKKQQTMIHMFVLFMMTPHCKYTRPSTKKPVMWEAVRNAFLLPMIITLRM